MLPSKTGVAESNFRFKEGDNLERDRYELFHQMISNAAKTMNRLKGKYMSRYGLSGTHTICLRQLFENEMGLTKSEIADYCDIDKAQITRIIGELMEKGYVSSDESKKAYNRKFFLTERGKIITNEINEVVVAINRYVSEDIPMKDIKHFYATFDIINGKLKEYEEDFEKIEKGFEK